MRILDVTKFDTIPGLAEAVLRDYGQIDVLINNAGFAVAGFAEDIQARRIAPAVRDQILWRRCHDQGGVAVKMIANDRKIDGS